MQVAAHVSRVNGQVRFSILFSVMAKSFLRRAHVQFSEMNNQNRGYRTNEQGGTNMKPTMEDTMTKLAENISKESPEKQEEIRIFLEGYMAGLEHVMRKAAQTPQTC